MRRVNLDQTNATGIALLDRCDICWGSCYPQFNPNPTHRKSHGYDLQACNELIIAVGGPRVALPSYGCAKCSGTGIRQDSISRYASDDYRQSLLDPDRYQTVRPTVLIPRYQSVKHMADVALLHFTALAKSGNPLGIEGGTVSETSARACFGYVVEKITIAEIRDGRSQSHTTPLAPTLQSTTNNGAQLLAPQQMSDQVVVQSAGMQAAAADALAAITPGIDRFGRIHT